MAQPSLPDGPQRTVVQIADDMARAWARIKDEEARLLAQWPGQTKPVRLERLRAMETHVTDLMGAAQATLDSKVPGLLTEAYEIGAWGSALQTGAAAAFSAIDLDAITVLARDTMDDLLAGTRGVTASTRSLVQTMSRDRILNATYGGLTAEQAGVRLAADLQGEGIYSILYNGSPPRRVALPTYTDMVVRTKTAVAYQEGGFQQGKQLGIEWWEIMDGPDCGLSFHDDPTLADGMIVRTAEAEKFPISHPNCVRVTSPRPDIADAREAAAAKPTPTEKQREDQAAASRAREAAYARNPRRNSLTRQVDREMGLRSQFDRTQFGAMSPAEARSAARIAKAPSALTPEQAIAQYTTSDAFALNAALRAGGAPTELVKALDGAFETASLSRGVKVRRVVSGRPASELISKFKSKVPFTDDGFMSFQKATRGSIDDQIADFAPGAGRGSVTVIEMQLPKGARAIDVGNPKGGLGYDQGEVLLPRGTSLRLVSARVQNGVRVVKAELIEDAAAAAGKTSAAAARSTARVARADAKAAPGSSRATAGVERATARAQQRRAAQSERTYKPATKASFEEFDESALRGKGTGTGWSDNGAGGTDDLLAAMWRQNGFDGKPQLLTDDLFEAAVEASPQGRLYRGFGYTNSDVSLTPAQMIAQWRDGVPPYAGQGFAGNGTYSARDWSTAARFAENRNRPSLKGEVIDMTIDPQARGITMDALRELQEEALRSRSRGALQRIVESDPGRFATSRGYDYIVNDGRWDWDEVIILNRSAVIMRESAAARAKTPWEGLPD